jgi:type VI secretion system protein ImpF
MDSYSPSLLDKLLPFDAGDAGGVHLRHSKERIKDGVARDIEMLLNCRASDTREELQHLPNVARSHLTMGLVDISSMSLASDRDRQRITDAIKNALLVHDGRLTQVEVTVVAPGDGSQRLVFAIRANLMLRPDAEPVSFDAVLQPGSNRYEVSKGGRRAFA